MKNIAFALLTASILGLTGCQNDNGGNGNDDSLNTDFGGESLATVNGQTVSDDLLAAFVSQYPNVDMEGLEDQQREQLTDHVINLAILAQEARNRGLHENADTQASLALNRMQTLSDRLIRQIEAETEVSDEAIQAAYDERYGNTSEYKARHILVEEESQARDMISQLDEGADFATLAQENSTGPSSENGGDLGWFSPDQMVPPFAEALQTIEPGSYGAEPVETQFGWHVILVEDTRESDGPALEEVREQIVNSLRQEEIQTFVSELRENANVERATANEQGSSERQESSDGQ